MVGTFGDQLKWTAITPSGASYQIVHPLGEYEMVQCNWHVPKMGDRHGRSWQNASINERSLVAIDQQGEGHQAHNDEGGWQAVCIV